MDKKTFVLLITWLVLAILHIVGLFTGLNVFFMVVNDLFGILNGFVCIAMIPIIIEAIKDWRKK